MVEGTTVVQPPCSSWVSPGHLAQDCVQRVPKYLQWGKCHNLSGQPAPLHGHLCIKISSLCSGGAPVLVSAHCLLSYCLAPRTQLHRLDASPSDTCKHPWGLFSVVSFWMNQFWYFVNFWLIVTLAKGKWVWNDDHVLYISHFAGSLWKYLIMPILKPNSLCFICFYKEIDVAIFDVYIFKIICKCIEGFFPLWELLLV